MTTSADPEAQALIDAVLAEGKIIPSWYRVQISVFESGRKLLAADKPMLARVVTYACARAGGHNPLNQGTMEAYKLGTIITQTLPKKPAFSRGQLVSILNSFRDVGQWALFTSWRPILTAIENDLQRAPMTDDLATALRRVGGAHAVFTAGQIAVTAPEFKDVQEARERIREILVGKQEKPLAVQWPFIRGLVADAEQRPDKAAFLDLLHHARDAADGTAPSKKWFERAEELVAAAGRDTVQAQLLAWLVRGAPQRAPFTLPEPEADLLKGVVWLATLVPSAELTRAIADTGETCLRKIPNLGPVSARAGNACVNALSRIGGKEAIAQLGRLKARVKYATALRLIEKAFAEACERQDLQQADLEELAVPTFGLGPDGTLQRALGDCTATLAVHGVEAELSFARNGRLLKTIPAEVKQDHAAALLELRKSAKAITALLPAQRQRVEGLLVSGRMLPVAVWWERYVQHPLMTGFARRLIWHFRRGERAGLGAFLEDQLVDAHDAPLDWIDDTTEVRLWHPLGFDPAEVQRWRHWLQRHAVTQPFKQAHRELYILTDAERETETYSNRFAGHILRQHQFAALLRQRGWAYHLQGAFDGHNTPTLRIPGSDLSVEYWVDSPEGHEDTSGTGIYLHVFTDQVRFVQEDGRARPLLEIPATLFSEIMRDVDLFVSVCSVGADPAWQDHGERAILRDYWALFQGRLSESAESRRGVLAELLPALKIRDRCTLEERFLQVRGELATYRIHLSSGNIFIEPGSRYLCIVPARGRIGPEGRVFLPFDGDSILSTILSKAFLLANDRAIKDPTIQRQLLQG